jgi:hypothetical protein|tara:strand:+ start:130 stop:639 length:510 start_codon:yes stop_codon:yes gene_type:complete
MEVKVIDNFLPKDVHEDLVENLCFSVNLPLYFQQWVSHPPELEKNKEIWNWYATHEFYNFNKPTSNYCQKIVEIFVDRLIDFKSLMRIKLNFYPHTETLREHGQHVDYDFSSHAAIYSLNTCDGFTRLSDGTKIDSVANRMLFFDGSTLHNSSTTTNAKGRYNINFNYL